ncbi:MAG TPA: hypothetical protein V6D09_08900 [Leptolyngbyaceae cyanobacterium]
MSRCPRLSISIYQLWDNLTRSPLRRTRYDDDLIYTLLHLPNI